MARKQIINPLVGFGQRSIGPYANRIGAATYARHVGLGDFEPPVVATLYAFGADDEVLKGLVTATGDLAFARANATATVTDFEGLVKTPLAEELRFVYGRRVANLEVQNTEQPVYMRSGGTTPPAFDNATTYLGEDCASVTFVAGSNTGYGGSRVTTEDATTGGRFTTVAGREYLFSCDVVLSRVLVGSERVTLYYTGAFGTNKLVLDATHEANKTTWNRASVPPVTFGNGGQDWFAVYHETAVLSEITVYFTKRHFEDVTGQANQNPSDYVSVGVLTASAYGRFANVDGVRYYDDTNGNTVSGEVVIEAAGTTLFTDTLDSERDLSDWGLNEVTLGGSVVAVDGTTLTSNGIIPSSNEGPNHLIGKFPVISEDNTPYTYRFLAKKGAGSDWVYGRFETQAGSLAVAYFDVDTGAVGTTAGCIARIKALTGGWYQCDILANSESGTSEVLLIYCADADNTLMSTGGDGSTVWTYIDFPELLIGLGEWRALFEPAATNYADGADDLSGGPETVDVTAGGTGDFTLSVSGDAAVTVAAGTATGTGFAQATVGNDVTFNLSVTGTVTLTLDSGALDKTDGLAQKQIEKAAVASSWIPTSGGSATRSVDDGTPFAQVAGNVDETKGMLIFDLNSSVAAADLPATTAIVSLADAVNSLFRLEAAADELKSFDGTNTASDSLAFAKDNWYRFAVRWNADDSEFQVGYKDVTGTGSWQWGTAQAFDGAYVVGTDINMFFSGPNAPQRIKNLRIYGSDQGTSWIESNF